MDQFHSSVAALGLNDHLHTKPRFAALSASHRLTSSNKAGAFFGASTFAISALQKLGVVLFCVGLLAASVAVLAAGENKVIHLYLDMDFANAVSSSTAIERGISTALSEVEDKLDGYKAILVKKDHRGNTRRSSDNLVDFLADDKALALFAGLHSPPLIANREFINRHGILVLIPWAAAGEITRHPGKENWIFRLSVDDTKAGRFLVHHAIKRRGFRRPALLLEQTDWGYSNERNMSAALAEYGLHASNIAWFNWGIQENAARIVLRDIIKSKADAILLVANAPEAENIVRAMLALDKEQRLPIISHWGLTGGDFAKVIGPKMREALDLSFLQTRFSFISAPDDPFGKQVLAKARQRFPGVIRSGADIEAPAGFIHAYDLTRILISAVRRVGLSGDIKRDRQRVRQALEQLDTPIKGLVKTYDRPFLPFDPDNSDTHEALSADDLRMARYREDGAIILEKEFHK